MKKILFSGLMACTAIAFAEDLPFWGGESSNATNVVPSASKDIGATVDMRWFTEDVSNGIDFSSIPVGFLLLFR